MEQTRAKILVIGAGKMGAALVTAWLSKNEFDIAIVDLGAKHEDFPTAQAVVKSIQDLAFAPDCIVLAVKPQSMDFILPQLAEKFDGTPLYLSIAAGKTITYFEKTLGKVAIIRTMPNTPALIGKGISALIANKLVSEPQKQLAASLMKAAGRIIWLDDESQMDAVTALSGSGPAYMFLLLECMIEAGVKQGLSKEVAKELAVETMHGSSELARKLPDELSILRENVTSPGGTTAAALAIFMHDKALNKLVDSAITHAVKRSKELG